MALSGNPLAPIGNALAPIGLPIGAKGFPGSWNYTGCCSSPYSFVPINIYSVVPTNFWQICTLSTLLFQSVGRLCTQHRRPCIVSNRVIACNNVRSLNIILGLTWSHRLYSQYILNKWRNKARDRIEINLVKPCLLGQTPNPSAWNLRVSRGFGDFFYIFVM